MRTPLPDTRKSITHKVVIRSKERVKILITVGLYESGQPGEIFIVIKHADAALQGLAAAWATALSLCLQEGVELSRIIRKFKYWRFEPAGLVESQEAEIHTAQSIVDYVARWLELTFTTQEKSCTK